MDLLFKGRDSRIRKAFRDFRKSALHRLHVDDDILQPSAKKGVEEILIEHGSIDPADEKSVSSFLEKAPARLERHMPRRKGFAGLVAEYADILAVAFMVAFGIRALFLQPFKIPTSSMQPTLFGIHYIENKNTIPPALPAPLSYAAYSAERAFLKVEKDGVLDPFSFRQRTAFLLFPRTTFNLGGVAYTLPGEPKDIARYCDLGRKQFKKGDVLCDGWLSQGDHLFVDRLSHHFREPARGDVIVFNTEGVMYNSQKLEEKGFYYIKRLVGMPGDTLRVSGNMVHVKPKGAADFRPITELSPAFAKVYSGKGGYHGHLNAAEGRHLVSPSETFVVPEDSYFAMGDNSASSFDSRYWGVVPRANFVGRAFWVFWPFSRRWGIADSAPPLDIPTDSDMTAMRLQ